MTTIGPTHVAFAELADFVGDGLVVADAQGKLVYFNEAAERLVGLGVSDLPASEWPRHYGVFLPDGVTPSPPESSTILRALRGEETNGVEQVIRNPNVPDGVLLSVTGRPIRNERGEITGAVVSFRDVTELRRVQSELSRTVEELRTLERQKSELATLLVHDLQSPLAVILGNADLLLKTPKERMNLSALRDIQASAETLHRMVLDLLDVSLSETGAIVPRLEPIELEALLREVAAALAYRAQYREQRIVVGDVAVQRMRSDRELVRRILQNLIENSIKYAPSSTTIALEAARGGDHVLLRVRDQGPGVPAEYRERVFELRTQVERAPELRNAGSRGLGLRFCRIAVEALQGAIWVEDDVPSGARFCVRLPLGE